jgi:hypothetical protein
MKSVPTLGMVSRISAFTRSRNGAFGVLHDHEVQIGPLVDDAGCDRAEHKDLSDRGHAGQECANAIELGEQKRAPSFDGRVGRRRDGRTGDHVPSGSYRTGSRSEPCPSG